MSDERPSRLTEQRFAELRALADSLGLVVVSRCKHCGAPLWSKESLSAHAGPVCRARHKEAAS